MKIPFDIKFRPQIESGEYKVETRDGKPTRIVCWDLKGNEDFFILALVEKNEKEVSYCYPATGCCKAACDPEGKDDLFLITPEPELSEFENKLRVICEDAVRESQLFPERTSEDFAKKHSAELLNLARKELCEQIVDHTKEAYENGKAEALKEFCQPIPHWEHKADKELMEIDLLASAQPNCKEYRKHIREVRKLIIGALKDLPRWNRLYSKENADKIPDCIIPGKALDNRLVHRGFELKITDLEKLPGFNENEK